MSPHRDWQQQAAAVDRAAVFEVLPTPYVVLTPELIIVDMNAAYLAVTGRHRDDLIGQPFLEAFPPPPDTGGADGRSELQVSLERVATRVCLTPCRCRSIPLQARTA